MNMSPKGSAILSVREGERLKAYVDTVGVLTIGVGHTGPDVKPGMTITREQSQALLKKDLEWAEAAVNKVRVPLNQNQFDALVSFVFNIGATAFAKSTLLKLLNAGDYSGAAAQFMVWTKQKELTGRRQGERDQFMSRP
jgi:lysozyme